MDANVEKLPKGQVAVHLTLTPEELEPFLDAAVREQSERIKVPGFRPGKVPRDVIEERIGATELRRHAVEHAIPRFYREVIEREKLTTVGKPDVDVETIVPGKPVVIRATVALLPSVELPDLKKIRVERKAAAVPEGELDRTLENLRQMFAKEARVRRPAAKGDKLEVDINVFRDNVAVDGGQARNHPVTLGEGHHIPGFEEQLVGLDEGATREFQLTFPTDYASAHLRGKPAQFRVKVNAVYQVEKPALDDAFAQRAGKFSTLQELREKIGENLKEEAEVKEEERYEVALLDAVIAKSTFSAIPTVLVDGEIDKMFHELRHELERRGMMFNDYLRSIKKTEADLRIEFTPQAERRVRTALVLRAVAQTHDVRVDDAEVEAELDRERELHASDPNILKELGSDEYRAYVKNVLSSRKAMGKLKELADKRTSD